MRFLLLCLLPFAFFSLDAGQRDERNLYDSNQRELRKLREKRLRRYYCMQRHCSSYRKAAPTPDERQRRERCDDLCQLLFTDEDDE